jgi:leader peptidase (prepilin peptidase)/N-methyltransferase
MSMAAAQFGALGILLLLAGYAAAVDIKSMIIPDAINLAIFGTGLTACFVLRFIEPVSALCGAILGGGLLLLVQVAFRAYRGSDGLGLGDVKFVAATASWTGAEGLPVALLAACAAALAYVIARRSFDTEFDSGRRIPFGPFLAFGAVAVATAQIWMGMSWVDFLERALP